MVISASPIRSVGGFMFYLTADQLQSPAWLNGWELRSEKNHHIIGHATVSEDVSKNV